MAKNSRGGKRGGGGSGGSPISTTSLISEREHKQQEVDEALGVFRDIQQRYGVIVDDIQVAVMDKKGATTMAYWDGDNIAVNQKYFDSKAITTAYDNCVKAGFHPGRGNKTAMEATIAHELGHALTAEISRKMGYGNGLDKASKNVCEEARKKQGKHRGVIMMSEKISGYARESNAECVAEAFCDVYCNGSKAKSESQAIVNVMNKYLK